jgi:peptidyl-prolyl cis-trans isomerase C
VIQLDDTRDAKLPPFEELKPQISQQMGQQKLANFQEELRKAAKIK